MGWSSTSLMRRYQRVADAIRHVLVRAGATFAQVCSPQGSRGGLSLQRFGIEDVSSGYCPLEHFLPNAI